MIWIGFLGMACDSYDVWLYMVKTVGQCRGQFKLSSCGPKKVHVHGKMVHLKIGAVGLGAQFPLERRNPVMVSNQRQSASVICASALVSLLFRMKFHFLPCLYMGI